MQGVKVTDLTKGNPGNGLPQWIRDAAGSRGYGDSTSDLSLMVTRDDIELAFAEAAQGNGEACVMAKAGTRLGVNHVYFYRTTAWVDFGDGPIARFQTSNDIWTHIIRPFDEGDKRPVRPGLYHLLAPTNRQSLKTVRNYNQLRKENKQDTHSTKPSTNPRPYMGRVVMAAHTTN